MIIQSRIQRQIIFDGNSLSMQGTSTVMNGMRYPAAVYSSIVSSNKTYTFQNYAIGGRQTHVLVSEYDTKIKPYIGSNDILIMWEITNDLAQGALGNRTAAQAIQDLADYTAKARSSGVFLVYLTMIARNMSGDPADLETKRLTVNAELRNNISNYCDLLIDVGALPEFDTVADCNNTTYYNADKTHLTITGYDLIATTVYNAIQSIL